MKKMRKGRRKKKRSFSGSKYTNQKSNRVTYTCNIFPFDTSGGKREKGRKRERKKERGREETEEKERKFSQSNQASFFLHVKK